MSGTRAMMMSPSLRSVGMPGALKPLCAGFAGPMARMSRRIQPSAVARTVREAAAGKGVDEQLFSAFQDLHNVARTCNLDFDVPAILVVGHQSAGKSALVEALMGFQFNDVGGGTTTRRPVCLHMEFDATAQMPRCFLLNDAGENVALSLADLKDSIRKDNEDLESRKMFADKEMTVTIQYQKCPNLTIIDLPGLMLRVDAQEDTRETRSEQLRKQETRVTPQSRNRVRDMAKARMKDPTKYIILALENVDDWAQATTCLLIDEVDRFGENTVLVSTKIDNRIKQFTSASDADKFLNPGPIMACGDMQALLGGPFFTCVPTGRLDAPDSVVTSDQAYRQTIETSTNAAVEDLQKRLGRPLTDNETDRIGISKLLAYLQQLMRRQYRAKLPTIVKQLSSAFAQNQQGVDRIDLEILKLDPAELMVKGGRQTRAFLKQLDVVLRGTPEVDFLIFGENTADEHKAHGPFCRIKEVLNVPENLHDMKTKLYGGAQVNRGLMEWDLTMSGVTCPAIVADDIANACGGFNGRQDRADLYSGAAKIAGGIAFALFKPCVEKMGQKMGHIVRHMLPVVERLLFLEYNKFERTDLAIPSNDAAFNKILGVKFYEYIDKKLEFCERQCLNDLDGITNYVVWDMHQKTSSTSAKQTFESVPVLDGGKSGMLSAVNSFSAIDYNKKETEEMVILLFGNMRDQFIRETHINFIQCFLLEIFNDFHGHLIESMAKTFVNGVDPLFDVKAAREQLATDRREMVKKGETMKQKLGDLDRIQLVIDSTETI